MHKILTLLLFIVLGIKTMAQSPDLYPPTVPEPVEKPVVYIAITIAVVAIYLFYRYSQNKKRNSNKRNENSKNIK